MPKAKNANGVSEQAMKNDVPIPRLKLGETGFTGLRTSNGQIIQEAQQVFRYPHFIKVVNEIRANPTVGAAMNVYNFMLARKEWCVKASEDASDITKERAEIIDSMMNDIDGGWTNFIKSVIPYIEYGYGIHEIVPRRRLNRYGSLYNDGLVGIGKLAVRNQETIAKWNFSEDGRELLSVSQSLAHVENAYRFVNLAKDGGYITIPRDKFLLFTANGSAGNPQGNSIYKNIYLAHKQLTMLQEEELLTVAKEAKGMMKIEVPAQYLQGEESPDGGAAATAFKAIIDGHNEGTTAGLLVPQDIDPDSKIKRFDYSLLESRGTPAVDVEAVIKRLQKDILIALSVDVLSLGADGSGSFALAESKTSILALAIDARLKEIQDVLNTQLIPYIYRMNGWDTSEMPEFEYEDEEDIDMEVFGTFVQKIASTGMIERDRAVLNRIREVLGVEEYPENEPVHEDLLTTSTSRSGDGMAVGTSGNGTSKMPVNNQSSPDNNTDNKGTSNGA